MGAGCAAIDKKSGFIRESQMKYGGQGGWRAVKRFNRDARVAGGSPPYGYRARYGSASPHGTITVGKNQRQTLWSIFEESPFVFTLYLLIAGPILIIFGLIFIIEWICGKIAVRISGGGIPASDRAAHQIKQRLPDKTLESVGESERAVAVSRDFEGQCEAQTKRSLRCKRVAIFDGLCTQHHKALEKIGPVLKKDGP